METAVQELRISPRRKVEAGCTIRLVMSAGSGPYHRRKRRLATLPRGTYRVIRLYRPSRTPARLFAEAVSERCGSCHTIYVAGPTYVSPCNPDVMMRPYRVQVVS